MFYHNKSHLKINKMKAPGSLPLLGVTSLRQPWKIPRLLGPQLKVHLHPTLPTNGKVLASQWLGFFQGSLLGDVCSPPTHRPQGNPHPAGFSSSFPLWPNLFHTLQQPSPKSQAVKRGQRPGKKAPKSKDLFRTNGSKLGWDTEEM